MFSKNSNFSRVGTQVMDGVCVWVSVGSARFTFPPQRIHSSASHICKKKIPQKQIWCVNEKLWQQRLLQRWCRRSGVSNWAARNRLNCCNRGNGSIWTEWWLIITARHFNVLSDVTPKTDYGHQQSNHPCLFDQQDLKFFKKWQQRPMIWFRPSAPLNNHNENND